MSFFTWILVVTIFVYSSTEAEAQPKVPEGYGPIQGITYCQPKTNGRQTQNGIFIRDNACGGGPACTVYPGKIVHLLVQFTPYVSETKYYGDVEIYKGPILLQTLNYEFQGPYEAGVVHGIKETLTIPEYIPQGKYRVKTHVYDSARDHIICVELPVYIKY